MNFLEKSVNVCRKRAMAEFNTVLSLETIQRILHNKEGNSEVKDAVIFIFFCK